MQYIICMVTELYLHCTCACIISGLGSLCESLQSTEPESLYSDLVRFLLAAIFSLQDEEEKALKAADDDQV